MKRKFLHLLLKFLERNGYVLVEKDYHRMMGNEVEKWRKEVSGQQVAYQNSLKDLAVEKSLVRERDERILELKTQVDLFSLKVIGTGLYDQTLKNSVSIPKPSNPRLFPADIVKKQTEEFFEKVNSLPIPNPKP